MADAIQNYRLGEDADYRDFAIHYRQNSLSRAVEDSLRRMNIPYRIYQGLSFYGRREVKDALAYLRLAINPHDDESLTCGGEGARSDKRSFICLDVRRRIST